MGERDGADQYRDHCDNRRSRDQVASENTTRDADARGHFRDSYEYGHVERQLHHRGKAWQLCYLDNAMEQENARESRAVQPVRLRLQQPVCVDHWLRLVF
jgi:hypothetical protein